MNVSRTACRWRASVTSRRRTIVSSRAPASRSAPTGQVEISIQRSSPRRARSSTGPPATPRAGATPSGVLELGQDLGVRRLIDVGEDVLGRRVGQDDPAVAVADDDALAHRPDDRVELGGSGVLRAAPAGAAPARSRSARAGRGRRRGSGAARRPAPPAGGGSRPGSGRRSAGWRLDGLGPGVDRSPASESPIASRDRRSGRRRRGARARGDREELVDRPAELLDRTPVGVADPAVLGSTQEDGVARRVEEALEPDALAEEPGVLDRARRPARPGSPRRRRRRARSAGRTRRRRGSGRR